MIRQPGNRSGAVISRVVLIGSLASLGCGPGLHHNSGSGWSSYSNGASSPGHWTSSYPGNSASSSSASAPVAKPVHQTPIASARKPPPPPSTPSRVQPVPAPVARPIVESAHAALQSSQAVSVPIAPPPDRGSWITDLITLIIDAATEPWMAVPSENADDDADISWYPADIDPDGCPNLAPDAGSMPLGCVDSTVTDAAKASGNGGAGSIR